MNAVQRARQSVAVRPSIVNAMPAGGRSEVIAGAGVSIPGATVEAQVGREALTILAVSVLALAAFNYWTRSYQR